MKLEVDVYKVWDMIYVYFFFFKQKTAYEILTCDWSSDVCSSDLNLIEQLQYFLNQPERERVL